MTTTASFRKGDRIQIVADGKLRVVIIETLTDNQRIAQCSWMVGSSKRYGMCLLNRASTALPGFYETSRVRGGMAQG